jgi:hypothetical protein
VLTDSTGGGYDLAILRADPAGFAAAQAQIAALTELSDRIVFAPVSAAGGGLDALTAWFEHFADLGYQPVVEYDAGYLADGAFLVDRNATAAETDLAGFAERLSLGGALHASTLRVAELEAELGGTQALKAELAAQRAACEAAQAEAATLRTRLAAAETRADAMAREAAAWAPLRAWIAAAIAHPPPQTVPPPRRGLARLFGRQRPAPDQALLRDAALLRACPLFDAPWYIASHPELAETGQDPVLHYLLTGAAQGFDPGPWFETAAYLDSEPGLDPARTPPLIHAIRTGKAAAYLARMG